jgi:hypothetical protein
MPEIGSDAAIQQLLAILREAFEGPPEKSSYFVDNDSDAGYLGTLHKLNASEASQAVGGSTIAAHVHHMIFSLEASASWIRGDRSSRNWQDSWRTRTADQAEWSRMLDSLRTGYEDLRESIESHGRSSEDAFGGAAGALAHAAYHLGAIRQKMLIARRA